MRIMVALALILTLISCNPDGVGDDYANGILAYVPVYAKAEDYKDIAVQSERPTINAGKIYAYGRYIFQNEIREGIHVIDNSDPEEPKKKAFISIPLNTEMAVHGNYIYANSINDLIVIDISDPLHPVVKKTMKDAFPLINQKYPAETGYFVCPDPSKGIVIGWEQKTVQSPACRR